MPLFHWRKRMATEFASSQSIQLSCGERDDGTLSEMHAKSQSRPTLLSWRLPCYRCGMISHRRSLIMQSCHFERQFAIMCCCSWWTFWTLSLNREGSWHSSPKLLSFWRKSCAFDVQSLIRYYWIFRTRQHVHLNKWTLKFKLLYLLNHIRCFNKISGICGLNSYL